MLSLLLLALLTVLAGVTMLRVSLLHELVRSAVAERTKADKLYLLIESTAAIMRIGLMEMKRFSEEFFKGVKPETFTETSAGIADLITTCEC